MKYTIKKQDVESKEVIKLDLTIVELKALFNLLDEVNTDMVTYQNIQSKIEFAIEFKQKKK